jgi:hypothetical protein
VAQKIELILVEAALESQQQPVVALTRRIDRLLIDRHGIERGQNVVMDHPNSNWFGDDSQVYWCGTCGAANHARELPAVAVQCNDCGSGSGRQFNF